MQQDALEIPANHALLVRKDGDGLDKEDSPTPLPPIAAKSTANESPASGSDEVVTPTPSPTAAENTANLSTSPDVSDDEAVTPTATPPPMAAIIPTNTPTASPNTGTDKATIPTVKYPSSEKDSQSEKGAKTGEKYHANLEELEIRHKLLCEKLTHFQKEAEELQFRYDGFIRGRDVMRKVSRGITPCLFSFMLSQNYFFPGQCTLCYCILQLSGTFSVNVLFQ